MEERVEVDQEERRIHGGNGSNGELKKATEERECLVEKCEGDQEGHRLCGLWRRG